MAEGRVGVKEFFLINRRGFRLWESDAGIRSRTCRAQAVGQNATAARINAMIVGSNSGKSGLFTMKLSVAHIGDGLHPSEMLVEVETRTGPEEMIVDKTVVKDGKVEVGAILGAEPGYTLVQLPRETMRGAWRVWVPNSAIVEGAMA